MLQYIQQNYVMPTYCMLTWIFQNMNTNQRMYCTNVNKVFQGWSRDFEIGGARYKGGQILGGPD